MYQPRRAVKNDSLKNKVRRFDGEKFKREAALYVHEDDVKAFQQTLKDAEILVGLMKVKDLLNEYISPNLKTTPLLNACFKGRTWLCAILIFKYKVNIETSGVVLDDPTGAHLTPLLAAIRQNRPDIVKMLIAAGVKINVFEPVKFENPLFEACRLNNAYVFELLLTRNGVHTSIAEDDGLFCFDEAARVGSVEIATFLLERAIHNLDSRGRNGTPLEMASYWGHVSVLRKLMEYGANPFEVNRTGLLPIMIAAGRGKLEATEYLLSFKGYSRQQIIDAIELLAASLESTNLSFMYLERALVERLKEPVLRKPEQCPSKAYQFRMECQTMEELRLLPNDTIAFELEKLLIWRRLCSCKDRDFAERTYRTALKFAEKSKHKESLELLIYSPLSLDLLSPYIRERVRFLMSKNFAYILIAGIEFPMNCFLRILTATAHLAELSRELPWGDQNPDYFLDSALCLTFTAARLLSFDAKISESIKKQLYKAVKKLVQARVKGSSGDSLLHLSVSQLQLTTLGRGGEFIDFPDLQTVRLLIDCGADVNAFNENGHTPMHLLIKNDLFDSYEKTIMDITSIMIKAGANHGFTDNQGLSPFDELEASIYYKFFSKTPASLKYLAAKAVDILVPEEIHKLSPSLRLLVKRLSHRGSNTQNDQMT